MAKTILVAYATNAGSTVEVAETIAEELRKTGAVVEVRNIQEVDTVTAYDAAAIGAPMILGWHRSARKFIRQHRKELGQMPVAYFFTAVSLTDTGEKEIRSIPVWVDQYRAKAPKNPAHLSFRERYSLISNYLAPALEAAPEVKPVSAAFFGGKLDIGRLKFFQMLFVLLVIQAQPGDFRDWDFIRLWADHLGSVLGIREV